MLKGVKIFLRCEGTKNILNITDLWKYFLGLLEIKYSNNLIISKKDYKILFFCLRISRMDMNFQFALMVYLWSDLSIKKHRNRVVSVVKHRLVHLLRVLVSSRSIFINFYCVVCFFLKNYLRYCINLERGFLKNIKGETWSPLSFHAR